MQPERQLGYVILEGKEPVKEFNIVGDKGNKIIAEGYLQTDLNKKNRNGRIYGVPGIKSEVEGARIRELIKTGNLKGHDGHPSDPSLAVQQTIDPKLTSVKYLDVWMDGENVAARFCGTNTEYGKAFNADLAEGELPSFSLRALGSVANKGGNVYVENVKIVTWDRVYYPSHERAYTTKIVSESAGINASCGMSMMNTNNESGILIPITNQSMINFIKQESANVKTIMESFDVFFESAKVINEGRCIQLVGHDGEVLIVTLENYVQNQIMDYLS